MCGEMFWKRVIAFCLTFALGVFVSGFFIAKELPAKNIKPAVVPAPAENKNCVPVDENLKYQTLENNEPTVSVQSEEAPKLCDSKKYEKPKLRKENQKK